jgi:hypothetical protein
LPAAFTSLEQTIDTFEAGDAMRVASSPPDRIAGRRKLISVAVAQIDRNPVIRDSGIDAALEISVADIGKIGPRKDAPGGDFVTRENAENLSADFFIGRAIGH